MSSSRLGEALADRYRIERELGQGGMATVYLAQDLKHDRKVALKVLKPELSAVLGAERFLTEIKTTANLQHPHILPLHDSGSGDGTVFYVMPFVPGESLRDRLTREKQLPIADAIRLGAEVAGALDYAHRQGIIHRDIKPENILLHDGRALVADFGIALAASRTDGGTRMTETGMSLGTPHYMSPEQAMGERTLDARTDIYALGCVIYEMLTGEPPHSGPTAQAIVAKVLTDEPRPLTQLRKSVPEHVDDAVLTALAKLPADRFSTAGEFAAALQGATTVTRPRATPGRASMRGSSPDGRWLAYTSNESGRYEVYVASLASPDEAKWPVSNGGGITPRWSRRGNELFYLDLRSNMVAAQVATTPSFSVLSTRVLFNASDFILAGVSRRNFDVGADDQRFLMVQRADAATRGQVVVVEHWLDEIRRKGMGR